MLLLVQLLWSSRRWWEGVTVAIHCSGRWEFLIKIDHVYESITYLMYPLLPIEQPLEEMLASPLWYLIFSFKSGRCCFWYNYCGHPEGGERESLLLSIAVGGEKFWWKYHIPYVPSPTNQATLKRNAFFSPLITYSPFSEWQVLLLVQLLWSSRRLWEWVTVAIHCGGRWEFLIKIDHLYESITYLMYPLLPIKQPLECLLASPLW